MLGTGCLLDCDFIVMPFPFVALGPEEGEFDGSLLVLSCWDVDELYSKTC